MTETTVSRLIGQIPGYSFVSIHTVATFSDSPFNYSIERRTSQTTG